MREVWPGGRLGSCTRLGAATVLAMGLLDRFKSSPKDRFAQLALTLQRAAS